MDICAFLNSNESYGKDKFIVIGINDKTHDRIGIKDVPMFDDGIYQEWAENIQPRPIIETGTIKYENKKYGYFFISKENKRRVYSIKKSQMILKDPVQDDMYRSNLPILYSEAYIRKGSRKSRLDEWDRREIYEKDRKVKEQENNQKLNFNTNITDNNSNEILKICALFGEWNENNEKEKNVISEAIGKEYNIWIKGLRKQLNNNSKYLEFNNEQWKIKNKEEIIFNNAKEYFPDDIKKFSNAVIKIETEKNPRYDLKSDKRIMENIILDKKSIYSSQIRKNVLETVAYIKSVKESFTNCEIEVENMLWNVVRKVMENADWKILATLNELLPTIAEINGSEYIVQLNKLLKNNEKEIEQLFNEKEEFVTERDYVDGLIWSLELLSWNPKYIMDAFDLYGKFSKYNSKKILDSMVEVILPWNPHTLSDSKKRENCVEVMLIEYENIRVGFANEIII